MEVTVFSAEPSDGVDEDRGLVLAVGEPQLSRSRGSTITGDDVRDEVDVVVVEPCTGTSGSSRGCSSSVISVRRDIAVDSSNGHGVTAQTTGRR